MEMGESDYVISWPGQKKLFSKTLQILLVLVHQLKANSPQSPLQPNGMAEPQQGGSLDPCYPAAPSLDCVGARNKMLQC